ncbi:hypothetical protein DEIPH_ctg018orf0051 [Deinococcus phoenicis]|uniref:Uncharacterized protein n=1 Tax=Deinococcus phoenicis TaxID=1476583 RepID=A0A016QRP8_9DEIO|nr:hypothetical protein [Deinococcus phoenicis]EYB68656.1 hypothetical protein DEIPH_ctg018orf0051 [Deinococcus phoenicis]
MLSDEEMRRIEEEELAAARALQVQQERARHQLALHAYRQEVRSVLQPPKAPWWRPGLWLLPVLVVLAGVILLRPSPAGSDDASGGITASALMDRCQAEVGAQLGLPELRFPSPREAAGQMSANADGKRWDGWVTAQDRTRTDFSCRFTAADSSVQVELLEETP